jgi:cardiolipin-specific phospholipase
MDLDLLADYLYHITVADPSGEFAMNSLLEPAISPDVMGVFARESLEEHFPALEQQHSSSVVQQIKVLYGDHDWMRPNEPSARKVLERLRQQTGMDVSVDIVPNAGHHLYLDNSVDFVRHILKH